MEIGAVAEVPEETDGHEADGEAVVDARTGDAEAEHEGGEGEPRDRDDGSDGPNVRRLLGLLVDAHDRGDHLSHDGEGQQHAEGADASDAVIQNLGGGAEERGELGGEHLEDHEDDHAGVEREPEALRERVLCGVMVASTKRVADDGRHCRAEEAAEGEVDVLDRHDDADAGESLGTEAVAHDEALEDDHDDLGDHALHRDATVLADKPADRCHREFVALLGLG